MTSAATRGPAGQSPVPVAFISHATEDHARAIKVCRALESEGIVCWIAPRDVAPGADYAHQILDGIESTRVMVLLLSGSANHSSFVSKEVERAVSKGKVVIPFRIEDVVPARSLELFVSQAQWIDAWTPPLEARARVLAAAIRGLLQLPPLQDGAQDAGTHAAKRGMLDRLQARLTPRVAGVGIAGAVGVALVLALVTGLLPPKPSGSGPAKAASGTFTATGSMTSARGLPTVVGLKDGRVLVLGGWGDEGALASAEVYDPASGTFTATGSMGVVRGLSTATLLNDGRVLVTGGQDEQVRFLSSAEIYDPTTGQFSLTGSTSVPRHNHTATLLSDGRVLVVGSYTGAYEASAEIYDPSTGRFTPTGSMAEPRGVHTAALLKGGWVLIVGGRGYDGSVATTEVYDPNSGTFYSTGSLLLPRAEAQAVGLESGRVLVVGGAGWDGSALSSAEVYDPTSGVFSPTPSMSKERAHAIACLLPDGGVLVAGGKDAGDATLASAEVFDVRSGAFKATGTMTTPRAAAVCWPLADGRILVAGGDSAGGNQASAEVYQP